jgi:uncharacterized glyoxalase superfamily protein PhnB
MNIIKLYEDVLPHSLIGDKQNISTARIVSTVEQAQTLDGTVLIANNLQEVISFYRESFGYKELTLTSANEDEAIIGVNNKMKVEHNNKLIDCTKMNFQELSVARFTVCSDDEVYKHATAALYQLLSNYPFATPGSSVTKLYNVNESLDLMWAIEFANKIIDRKKARILKDKKITKAKGRKTTWSKLFKIPDFMQGNYLNCSDTGYGKTELNEKIIKHCIKNGMKVLYVVHRITIADNNINIPDVTHYKEIMPGTERDIKCLKIVANSIIKTNLRGFMNSVDVVILEEGKQGLDFIATGTVEQREKVFETLKMVCKNAKAVIVSDADSNDRTLKFIRETTGKDAQLMHGHMDFSDKTINMIDYNQALGEIDQVVGSEPIMIATDSKLQADRLYSKYKNNDGVNAIVITSDNIRNAETQEFLKNINHNKQYNLVIYSPAIVSSLSVVFDRYKLHYGLFNGVVTSGDAIQMLRRNRPCANFRVGVRSRKEYLIDNINELLPDDSTATTELDTFIAKVEAEGNYNRNNIQAAFYFCAQHEGFNVVVSKDTTSVEIGETAQRSATSIESNEFKRRMLSTEAADSTYNAEAMANGGESSSANSDAIERKKIERTLGKTEITRKDLSNYSRGRLTSLVKNIELLRAERTECESIDQKDSGADRDRKKFTIHHDFFNKIFNKLGLCPLTGQGSFTVEDANDLLEELMIDRKKFNKMRFGKKLPAKLPKIGTRTVIQLLEQFGFETENAEREDEHGKRTRHYSIIEYSIEMMNEYLVNRQRSGFEVVKSRISYIR